MKKETKSFFWKDKTGRGNSGKITLQNILKWKGKMVNYDGESIKQWAKNASKGEQWENQSDSFICI